MHKIAIEKNDDKNPTEEYCSEFEEKILKRMNDNNADKLIKSLKEIIA